MNLRRLDPFTAYLVFTLYVGAARYDADAQQLERLQREFVPMLPGFRAGEHSTRDMMAKVEEIMGSDWRVPEPWAQYIVNIVKRSDGGRQAEQGDEEGQALEAQQEAGPEEGR